MADECNYFDENEEESKVNEIRFNKLANSKKIIQITTSPLKKNKLRNMLDENLILHDRI